MNEERRTQNAERRALTFLQKSLNEVLNKLIDHQQKKEAKKDYKSANDIRQFRYRINTEPNKWVAIESFEHGNFTPEDLKSFENFLKEKNIDFQYLDIHVQDVNEDALFPNRVWLINREDYTRFYHSIEQWNKEKDRQFDAEIDPEKAKKTEKNDDDHAHGDEQDEHDHDDDKKDKKEEKKQEDKDKKDKPAEEKAASPENNNSPENTDAQKDEKTDSKASSTGKEESSNESSSNAERIDDNDDLDVFEEDETPQADKKKEARTDSENLQTPESPANETTETGNAASSSDHTEAGTDHTDTTVDTDKKEESAYSSESGTHHDDHEDSFAGLFYNEAEEARQETVPWPDEPAPSTQGSDAYQGTGSTSNVFNKSDAAPAYEEQNNPFSTFTEAENTESAAHHETPQHAFEANSESKSQSAIDQFYNGSSEQTATPFSATGNTDAVHAEPYKNEFTPTETNAHHTFDTNNEGKSPSVINKFYSENSEQPSTASSASSAFTGFQQTENSPSHAGNTNSIHVSFHHAENSESPIQNFFNENAISSPKAAFQEAESGSVTSFKEASPFSASQPQTGGYAEQKPAVHNLGNTNVTGNHASESAFSENDHKETQNVSRPSPFTPFQNTQDTDASTSSAQQNTAKLTAHDIDLTSYNVRSKSNTFGQTLWDTMGAKQAIEEGGDQSVHTYHRYVQQAGLGDLGMMSLKAGDAAFYTSEGHSIEKIFSKQINGVGENDLQLFQNIMGKKMGDTPLLFDTETSAKASMSALAEVYSKNYLMKQNGKVQYSLAGKIASNESVEALYISLGGNSKLRIGDKTMTSRENLIRVLRTEARHNNIKVTEDDLSRLADKMLKSSKHVVHSANHAARARFNLSNILGKQIIQATQDDTTSQEIRRLSQDTRTVKQSAKIVQTVRNIHTEKKIQKLTSKIGKENEQLQRLQKLSGKDQSKLQEYLDLQKKVGKHTDQLKGLNDKNEKIKKSLERFKRENSWQNRAFRKIQTRLNSNQSYQQLHQSATALKQKIAGSKVGKAASTTAKVAGKPLAWIAKVQEVLAEVLKKALLVFIEIFLIFVAIVAVVSAVIVIALGLALLVVDFFIAPSDAFDPAKTDDSVMGKVYYELEYDETKWIQSLVTGDFMDKDYPPYVDQLTYTDTENMQDLRDMSAEDYVTNVLHMKYDKQRGAVLGPEPFLGAPADAYKWISLVDGGIEVEFRGRDGSYGYTSNIKEITSMTMSANISTSAPENEYTENDLDTSASDNDSPINRIANFFTSTVNAVRKAKNFFGSLAHNVATHIGAGIPGLADWWQRNSADHRAKIFMQYAKPLFDLSHDQAYGLEVITFPTLWTANGSQPYQVDYGSSSVYNSLGAPGENISGYQIDGTPIEVWMLSIAGETSGNLNKINGDRGRAYGIMQFDYRYDLVNFMNFAYKRNPEVWAGFKPYLGYKAGNVELVYNSRIINTFKQARNEHYDEYIADQCIFMRERYLTGGIAGSTNYVAQLKAKGIDLSQRNVAVSAAMLSVSVNQPVSVKKFVAKAKSSMTDEQLIDLLYDNANYKSLARFTNPSHERQAAKDLLTGVLNVSRSHDYGAGVVWNGQSKSYGPFFSSQTNADAHYTGNNTSDNNNTNTAENTSSTGTTETPTATNAKFDISTLNICNSNESQSQPVSEHNENGGYGCMSYSHFYYNDTDRTHLYYNGQMVAEAAPAAVLGRDTPCNAPNDAFFDEALESHPECWTINVGGVSGELRGSGPSGGYSSFIESHYDEGHGFSGPSTHDGGHSYTATITVDEWEENEGDSEDPDYVTYHTERTITFTHNCAHNHTGYYCGGHLILKVTGIITNITQAERDNDHSAYQDKMTTKSWKHAKQFEEPNAKEVSDAKDLFDIDLAITHKDGTFSKDFLGWNYDNIDMVTARLMDDWKELYGIEPVKSLDSIVGNLAATSGVNFISNLDLSALYTDNSTNILEEDLKKDPTFAKVVNIAKTKYAGPTKSVYSQAGHVADADAVVAKKNNNGRTTGRCGELTADGHYAFDCSGFVGTILKEAGITSAFYGKTTANPGPGQVIKDQSKIKPGDLMYFTGHVGIYCGNGILLDCGGRKYKNGSYTQGYVRFIKMTSWHKQNFKYILRVYN